MASTDAPLERLESTVHGLVQGVGFRWWVDRFARRHGLVGWVANLGDGSVMVVAEGSPHSLDLLDAALHDGPRGARVAHVESQRGPATGNLRDFEIRAGGHGGD